MIVRITYDDSRTEIFRTDELTDAKSLGEHNLLTNYELKMDEIAHDSLWLEMYWYDAAPAYREGLEKGEIPVAHRRIGWRFLLIDKSEIEHVEEVFLDNVLVTWREGGQLVFGALFNKQERLYYSEASHASISRKAVLLRNYLARKHPELANDPDALCELIGYPPEAFASMAAHESFEIKKEQRHREDEGK